MKKTIVMGLMGLAVVLGICGVVRAVNCPPGEVWVYCDHSPKCNFKVCETPGASIICVPCTSVKRTGSGTPGGCIPNINTSGLPLAGCTEIEYYDVVCNNCGKSLGNFPFPVTTYFSCPH